MKPIGEDHPLHRLFQGLVENAFCAEVGLCDPELTEYVARMLVDFVHVDRLYALQATDGKPLDQIADMLARLRDGTDGACGEDGLLVHRHIGDFALFWSGVYPERLRHTSGIAHKDRLLDYVAQGKRAYGIASRLADPDDSPPASLFGRLSRDFEFCCHGLGLVRQEWEHTDHDSAGPEGGLLY